MEKTKKKVMDKLRVSEEVADGRVSLDSFGRMEKRAIFEMQEKGIIRIEKVFGAVMVSREDYH